MQQLTEAVTYMNSDYMVNGSSKINRQEAAVYVINILGYKKVADITGIHQTGAADAANLKDSYVGSVAIAKGLGILDFNDKNEFRPKENLTRAETVDMILKIFGANNN